MTQAELCDKLYFDKYFLRWFRLGKQSNEVQNAPVIDFERDWEYEIRDSDIYFNTIHFSEPFIGEYERKIFKIGWEHAEF